MPLLVVPIFCRPGAHLGGQLDHAVVGQNHLRAVGDKELLIHGHAQLAQLGHFLQKSDRVQHHAVADDALAARPQHAAGNQLQHELLLADDDRVAGVVPARITRHGAEPLAQHVHNLALALVAPLGAQHYRRLCSHVRSRFWRESLDFHQEARLVILNYKTQPAILSHKRRRSS